MSICSSCRSAHARTQIPFGPYLALGAVLAVLVGETITQFLPEHLQLNRRSAESWKVMTSVVIQLGAETGRQILSRGVESNNGQGETEAWSR